MLERSEWIKLRSRRLMLVSCLATVVYSPYEDRSARGVSLLVKPSVQGGGRRTVSVGRSRLLWLLWKVVRFGLDWMLVRRIVLDLLDCPPFHWLDYSNQKLVCAWMALNINSRMPGHWKFNVSLLLQLTRFVQWVLVTWKRENQCRIAQGGNTSSFQSLYSSGQHPWWAWPTGDQRHVRSVLRAFPKTFYQGSCSLWAKISLSI